MIQFSELSENARIWVYTSNRFLSEQEKELILSQGYEFLTTWAAHGDKLKAAMEIIDDCFIILGVDQDNTSASGCSIDASITFFQKLEVELDITLLDWQNMAFIENEHIRLMKRSEFEIALKENKINTDVHIFQSNLKVKSDLKENRTIHVSKSNFKNLLSVKS